MSDALKKVQSGQKLHIPAAAYNAFVDAAIDHRQRLSNIGKESQPSHRSADIVLVRNDSGSPRQQFDILGIDGPIISPDANETEFRSRVALKGVTPGESHIGKFVVLAEPLANGKIGKAFIAGACPVKLNVDDDKEWQFAECVDSEASHLEPAMDGSTAILWREGGTGVQWAIVRLGQAAAGVLVEGVITSSTPIGPNRWAYTVEESEYLKLGEFGIKAGGRVFTAYNDCEQQNAATGIQGNGVDVDDLPEGVEIVPIGNGSNVRLTRRINCETLAIEWTFFAVNQLDGPCEA